MKSVIRLCGAALIAGNFLGIKQDIAFAQSPFDFLMPPRPTGAPDADKESAEIREMMKKPNAKQEYIKSCVRMLKFRLEGACDRNLPSLDKGSCKKLFAKNELDAKNKCQKIANGETVDIDFK